MQLRVARLCLDCEELHADSSCPRCASQSYAFLSNWLPVDERRKWRRPAPAAAAVSPWAQGPFGLIRAVGRWLAGEAPTIAEPTGPMTRAADHAAQFHFDGPPDAPPAPPDLDVRLHKPGVRKA